MTSDLTLKKGADLARHSELVKLQNREIGAAGNIDEVKTKPYKSGEIKQQEPPAGIKQIRGENVAGVDAVVIESSVQQRIRNVTNAIKLAILLSNAGPD